MEEKLTTAQRHEHAYAVLAQEIVNYEKAILETLKNLDDTADYEIEEHRRVSDGTSQWGNRVSSWKGTVTEELTVMRTMIADRPGNLITQIRERIRLAQQRIRELEREEPEGPWSAANDAGEMEAYEEIVESYKRALEYTSNLL